MPYVSLDVALGVGDCICASKQQTIYPTQLIPAVLPADAC